MSFEYLSRIMDEQIKEKIKNFGDVVLMGPKYCGKSTTAKLLSKTEHSFLVSSKLKLYKTNPKLALIGESPIYIDEWENIPEIKEYISKISDENSRYLLVNSSLPLNYSDYLNSDEYNKVILYPFSLYESKESNGKISLNDLFNEEVNYYYDNNESNLFDVAYYICRGGWPSSIHLEKEDSLEVSKRYLDDMFNYKVSDKPYFFNSEYAKMIVYTYARNISSEAPYTKLLKDIRKIDGVAMDDETLTAYLLKLKNLFVINDLDAWKPKVIGNTIVRSSPTRHFVDTSMATSVLSLTPDNLINDLDLFALLFEDLCVRDLRIYTEAIGGKVYHYKDSDGLECDAIVELKDGKWAAFETILGGKESIENATKKLLKFKDKLDYSENKKPSFLAIISACDEAYKTNEGIYVIPISMLKN